MDPPLPLPMSLLLACLPAIGWSAWRVMRSLAPSQQALVLTPPVAVTFWLVCLHVASYAFGSFTVGIVVGTVVPTALAAVVWLRRERFGPTENDDNAPSVPGWWLWGGAVLVMGLVSPAAFGWAFHDEINLTGHMSIASQMQNGIYPPRHLTMAGFELRYHYGFDTVAAAVGVLFRLPISVAIDLVTVISWGACWVIASEMGPRLLRHPRGWLLSPLVLLGGGLPVVCEPAYDAALSIWVAGCVVDQAYVGPPLVSYLFQHPWGLGLPLGLAFLSLHQSRRLSAGRSIVEGLLLLGLALSQLVLFVCLAAAGPVARAMEDVRIGRDHGTSQFPWKSIAHGVLPAVTSLVVASQIGGMFAPSVAGSMLTLRRGPTPTWLGTLEWNLSTFGLFLPLGLLGVVLLVRRRVYLPVLLLGGSMLLIHTVAHKVTWDIVKFSAVAHLAMAWGAGEVLVRTLSIPSVWFRRGALAVSSLLLVHAGVAFCTVFLLAPSGAPKDVLPPAHVVLEPDDTAVVEWLRHQARPGDVVYRRRKRVAYGYAQWGGLPQVWTDRQMEAFGFPGEMVAQRKRLLQEWPPEAAAYRHEGVRWFVLDAEDHQLRAHVAEWIVRGEAAHRRSVGALSVVELLPPP